jgi:hypothetical protein
MALPKYDAAASLYPSNRSYRGARHGSTFSVGATVVAQHDPCARGGGGGGGPRPECPGGQRCCLRDTRAGSASSARPTTAPVRNPHRHPGIPA